MLLHQRMVVRDGLLALLAPDERRNVLHRPRAVEGVHGDEIGEPFRLERHQPLLHAVGFELEDARRLAAPEKRVGLLVVVGDPVRVEVSVRAPYGGGNARVVRAEKRDAFFLDRKRLEAEEVHLEKPDRLDEVAVVLRREKLVAARLRFRGGLFLAALLRGGHDGYRLDERIPRNYDAARVDARLSDGALEPRRPLHYEVDRRVGRIERGVELGDLLPRLGKRYLGNVWDERSELVRVGEGVVHDAPDVLDGALRGHLSERHDVRDVVGAVFARHVVEHPFAPRVVEIDVDIGHRYAVGVEEAFEKEVVLYRIDVRDAERVGDGGARRGAAPRPDPHAALLPRGAYVVRHDEEVAGEAHRAYRVELELDALFYVVGQLLAPAPLRARPHERGEIFGLELYADGLVVAAELLHPPLGVHGLEFGLAVFSARLLLGAERGGDVELRHDRGRVELEFLDHVGDLASVRDELRVLGEDAAHVLLGLEPFLARIHEALLVAHLRARREREKDVVRVVVLLVEEVDVVRGDDADAELFAELEHPLDDLELAGVERRELLARRKRHVRAGLRRFVEHHLEGIVVAEKILVAPGDALGLGHVSRVYRAGDLARDAGRRTVQALVVLFEKVPVYARVVVEAVDVGERD